MMIDPTKRPPPLRPVPSRTAAPFAAVQDYGSLRPWADEIGDLNDPGFLRNAKALALDDSIWMADGRLNAIKAMQNIIVSHLVNEASMRSAFAKGVTDFSPIDHMDATNVMDPEIWRRAFREATYAALWHTMDDEDQVAVSIGSSAWESRSSGTDAIVDEDHSSLVSLDFPPLMRRPTFSDGTPVELFWIRPQPGRTLQIIACGPLGDADDEIAMTSFDVDSRMGSSEGAIRLSAMLRGGGEKLIAEGWVESAVGLIPWIRGLVQCHLQLDLRRCSIDLSLRTVDIPALPTSVDHREFAMIEASLLRHVLPVAVDMA